MKTTNVSIIFAVTAFILSIPLIAMQFSEEWDWKLFDFSIMSSLLIGSGLIFEFIRSRLTNTTHRIIAGIVILGLVLFTWAELAVGVIGTPFAGS
jgi:hypothetical protein